MVSLKSRLATLALALALAAGFSVYANGSVPATGGSTLAAASIVVAPGGSLETAYQQANPGDTICLQTGSYPYQRIAYDAVKGAAGAASVTIEPCSGATPTVDMIELGDTQYGVRAPNNLTIQNLSVLQTAVWDATKIRLINLTGKGFDVLGPANDVQVLGGDFGPCQAPLDGACTPRLIGTNIVVDGTHIHGMTSTDLLNYHVDGMFIRGCSSCTVSNSSFDANMITNIRIQNCCGLLANQNINLIHNSFGIPLDGSGVPNRADAVDVDTTTPGILFKDNLIDGFVQWGTTGTGTLTGNIMTNDGCLAASYSGNTEKAFSTVWRNSACAGDTLATAAQWDTTAAAWLAISTPTTTATTTTAAATTTTAPTTTATTTTAAATTATATTAAATTPAAAPTATTTTATATTAAPAVPTISSFSPVSGPVGTVVTVTGTNLDQATVVAFNQGGTVSFTVSSPTSLKATVPSGSQTGAFSLNNGQAVSAQPFTVASKGKKKP
jgi:hypothetical protein